MLEGKKGNEIDELLARSSLIRFSLLSASIAIRRAGILNIPDHLELDGVRGFHSCQDRLVHHLVASEGFARQDDLGCRQSASRNIWRNPVALDVFTEDFSYIRFS